MTDAPCLRPLEIIPIPEQGLLLRDPQGFLEEPVFVPAAAIPLLALFDGQHSRRDLQTLLTRASGMLVTSDQVQHLIDQFDELLLLDSARFDAHREAVIEEFRAGAERPATHAGQAYPDDPKELRAFLDAAYADEQGAGRPPFSRGDRQVCAVMAPHIDLRVGAPCYTHAYRALAEGSAARTFVVLGVAHGGAEHLFTATRKDFVTPLGTVRTDRDFLEALASRLPFDLFHDEYSHRREHSIEFQAVFLRHLFGEDARIVPLLVGSFRESLMSGVAPEQDERVSAFCAALRETLAEREDAAVILSVDLAHVGGRFGDDLTLSDELLEQLATADLTLLQAAEALTSEQVYAEIARDADARRVDGFPGLYTLLRTLELETGELLAYDQSLDVESDSVVSFASMAFYRSRNAADAAATVVPISASS